MSDLRTGKTFRKILRALAMASDGKRVAYCSESMAMANCYFKKAAQLCRTYQLEPTVKIDSHRIDFPGGVVIFTTEKLAQDLPFDIRKIYDEG